LCFSTPPFLAAASIFLFFQSFKPCARWRRSQEGTKGIARQRKLYKHTDRPRSQSISIQEPQEARAIAQFSLIVCRNIQICAPVPALSFFNFKISQTKFAPVLGIMSLYSFWCVFFCWKAPSTLDCHSRGSQGADVMCRLPCNQPPPPASPNNNKPYSPLFFISYFIPTLCLVYRP
jgi:hypothetical protein